MREKKAKKEDEEKKREWNGEKNTGKATASSKNWFLKRKNKKEKKRGEKKTKETRTQTTIK